MQTKHPIIIQGGMGIGISGWRLAKAVSRAGQLGVVSGTSLDNSFIRRLQDGDADGAIRRALQNFPAPDVAARIQDKYFIHGGKPEDRPYATLPKYTIHPIQEVLDVTVLANFVEVWLAKERHEGVVGINLLEKIQMPNLASLYGAILANVDYVLMGAGIPREIPGVLDRLICHKPAELKLDVEGAVEGEGWRMRFDPRDVVKRPLEGRVRPRFLAIVASTSLARFMARNSGVDGLIIEGPLAGGHNAPPRGDARFNDEGEPIYGRKDSVDIGKVKDLGLPFWLAGGWATPEKVKEALSLGACGVQLGTVFAFCEESGMGEGLKRSILNRALRGDIDIFTDPVASPTGFPFKVVRLPGTLSESKDYLRRNRVCDLGYLRTVYRKENGKIGYRCPAEPVNAYLNKGGRVEDTVGRKCLCNALMANIELGQVRAGACPEQPMQTSGDALSEIAQRFSGNGRSYGVVDVIKQLLPFDHEVVLPVGDRVQQGISSSPILVPFARAHRCSFVTYDL